jgi:hypothetical protein
MWQNFRCETTPKFQDLNSNVTNNNNKTIITNYTLNDTGYTILPRSIPTVVLVSQEYLCNKAHTHCSKLHMSKIHYIKLTNKILISKTIYIKANDILPIKIEIPLYFTIINIQPNSQN